MTLDPDRRRDFYPRFRAIAGLPDEWLSQHNELPNYEELYRIFIELEYSSNAYRPNRAVAGLTLHSNPLEQGGFFSQVNTPLRDAAAGELACAARSTLPFFAPHYGLWTVSKTALERA